MCRAVGGVANALTRPNLLGLEGKAAFGGGFGDWGEWEKEEEEGEDEREEKAKATGIADAATALVVATNL